jgi:hypothetical protein
MRALINSTPARPYMARLRVFNRLIWPSTCPLLQQSVTAFLIASKSRLKVLAKRCLARFANRSSDRPPDPRASVVATLRLLRRWCDATWLEIFVGGNSCRCSPGSGCPRTIVARAMLHYAARRRRGEPISTAFVESAVNEIIAKRMNKKQMHWSRTTVRSFLDVRTAVLNDNLEHAFRHRYPGFRPTNDD